jgi:hypothetical protein
MKKPEVVDPVEGSLEIELEEGGRTALAPSRSDLLGN